MAPMEDVARLAQELTEMHQKEVEAAEAKRRETRLGLFSWMFGGPKAFSKV